MKGLRRIIEGRGLRGVVTVTDSDVSLPTDDPHLTHGPRYPGPGSEPVSQLTPTSDPNFSVFLFCRSVPKRKERCSLFSNRINPMSGRRRGKEEDRTKVGTFFR